MSRHRTEIERAMLLAGWRLHHRYSTRDEAEEAARDLDRHALVVRDPEYGDGWQVWVLEP
jgi:hypothetical protein